MTHRLPTRIAGWLALGCACVAGMASSARAEMRSCTDQRVEYLVGGAGKTCSDSIVSSPPPARAPAGTPKAQGASVQNTVNKFDDEGRREILQQELRLARQGLAELDRKPALTAGAGTLDEQRQRRQGDITALESELGRLKKNP